MNLETLDFSNHPIRGMLPSDLASLTGLRKLRELDITGTAFMFVRCSPIIEILYRNN